MPTRGTRTLLPGRGQPLGAAHEGLEGVWGAAEGRGVAWARLKAEEMCGAG